MMSEPKQHHYIPKCYSKNFVNEDGYLKISDLWDNGRIFPRKSDSAFTAKYMYSQPVYTENCFDNSIEHFLSNNVETNWSPIIEKLLQRGQINQTDWGNIVQFICSMLVRTPITFDAVVELLRESVVRNISDDIGPPPDALTKVHLERTGQKKSNSVDLKDLIASDTVVVGTDPHRCITSMSNILQNIPIFQRGFSFGIPKILHNRTNLQFLTSDNPVCFFGGQRNVGNYFPYRIRNKNTFSFVFPISSQMALVNSSFVRKKGMHVDITDKKLVADINRIIAAFSYRYVFGENEKTLAIGREYQNICPRPHFEKSLIGDGVVDSIFYKFGKPKPIDNSWTYDIKR